MAAAEVRAAWQRTANRYFVQEDAKRAPKLACCSSSTKSQYDGDASDEQGVSSTIRTHPVSYNPMSDTKWLPLLHPVFTSQKDIANEQLRLLESELESMRDGNRDPLTTLPRECYLCGNSDPYASVHLTCTRDETQMAVGKLLANLESQYGASGFCLLDEELSNWSPVVLTPSKKGSSSGSTVEKVEPCWRTASRDELACFIQKKLHERIQNCDLPQPRDDKVAQSPRTFLEILDHNETFSYHLSHPQRFPACCFDMDMKHLSTMESKVQTDSGDSNCCRSTNVSVSPPSTQKIHPSKFELLEALCHSQTRAREAELAVKHAYQEKEHVLNLLFKQAYQLFAYKQWLQLLQLETVYLQLKSKDHPVRAFFPAWMPLKRKAKRHRQKSMQEKAGVHMYIIRKCALSIALLGLAGAGLLLGKLGWLYFSG